MPDLGAEPLPEPMPARGHARGHARSADAGTLPRRQVIQVLGGIGLAGVVVTLVSGCGNVQPQSAPSVAAAALAALPPSALDTVATVIRSGALRIGSAQILASAGVILSRPTATTYRVFSTVCTHQGATITGLTADGRPQCPLHGSTFDPVTGDALIGPAGAPLAHQEVTVTGDSVSLS